MKEKTILILSAMFFIFTLDAIAMLILHIDGTVLLASASAIAGLAGYRVAKSDEK